jgi:Icc-related predicted phosphoesterase
MDTAKKYMADHRYIDKGHFQPEDALRLHNEADDWIKSELGRSTKEIVVTHHAPTHFSISPVYRGDLMSPAFFNDREEFILERQPLIWINGHTHFNIDMMIGNTRVISNQRGYKNEGVQGFNPNLVIEV